MPTKKKSPTVLDPSPRKQAGTASAKALVEAVVTSAGELLIESGPTFTTNDVAKRAGVSIGSLYQYFPNKEAILAEATRRVNERFLSLLSEILESDAEAPQKVDATVDLACSDRFGDLELRRAIFMHVPRAWSHTAIADSERVILEQLTRLSTELVAWRAERDLPLPAEGQDGATVAFFMVRGAVQGALLYRPELLQDNRLADMIRRQVHSMFGG